MKRIFIVIFLTSLAVLSGAEEQKQSSQTPLVINTPQVNKFLKYAEQGNADAQFGLGSMYYEGKGVPQDYKKAIKWFRMAAEQGDADAQYLLGLMYRNGKGVSQDYKEAVRWYRMSAEQGDAGAQFRLGLMYANGEGVTQDYKKAIYWYTKAAEQGEMGAITQLNYMYSNGVGVPQDYKEAFKWSYMAAERGEALAQQIVGLRYHIGMGVIEDYVEAYKWYLLAGMNGADVSENKALLQERMTATQIAEGQRLAKEYVVQKKEPRNKTPEPINQGKVTISGFGTGFFISQNGYFITAAHVIENASSVKIYWRSNDYPAEKILIDKTLDIAILKIIGVQSSQAFPLSSSSQVQTGDPVFTLGFPQIQLQGIEPKYTAGSISSLSGISNDSKYFQISVPVQPGNSGGPLLNNQGQVVGLITSRLDDVATFNLTGSIPQNVNYALKGSFILPLLESLPDIKLKKSSNMDKSDAIVKAKNVVALVVCYE